MGFLDTLLGRTRLPRANEDRLFAITTAAITLQASAGLDPARRAGIVFKRLPPGRFTQAAEELRKLLSLQGKESALQVEEHTDELGFDWLIVGGDDFQGMVASLHSVAQTLLEEGLGDLLLACAFRFQQDGRPAYWIYAYKRAAFYPFVPIGGHRRDNAEELRLSALADKELPLERDQECWYALWDIPV